MNVYILHSIARVPIVGKALHITTLKSILYYKRQYFVQQSSVCALRQSRNSFGMQKFNTTGSELTNLTFPNIERILYANAIIVSTVDVGFVFCSFKKEKKTRDLLYSKQKGGGVIFRLAWKVQRRNNSFVNTIIVKSNKFH